MESRTLTKTLNQVFTNILLNQYGLATEKGLTKRCYNSAYKYHNSNIRCFCEVKQLESDHCCSPEKKFSSQANKYSISKRKYSIYNTLLAPDSLAQVPVKLFNQNADIESTVYDGIGWAGQPIVKRIHPILPEVYGDIPDIFNTVEDQKTTFSKSQLLTKSTNIQPTTGSDIGLSIENVGKILNYDMLQSNRIEELKTNIRKYCEPWATKLGKGQHLLTENIVKIQKALISENIKTPSINNSVTPKMKNENAMLKKEDVSNQKIVFKKMKTKKRKKTKVCDFKSNVRLQGGTLKPLNSKTNKPNAFLIKRKCKVDPSVFNERTLSQNLTRNKALRMESRQFHTGYSLHHPRPFLKTTEKFSISNDRKKLLGKHKNTSENKPPDNDCTCPELFTVKSKSKKTKICGKAAGIEKRKEINKWKPKMCLLETPVKYRNRTFVCQSKVHGKGKKGRQLPKCVKPEKNIAPRVTICPPNLITKLDTKSKICENLIVEEKVRKRTKVCKPVLLYAKEVMEIKVEKEACVNVKKTKSRHTKICSPLNNKESKKIQLRN